MIKKPFLLLTSLSLMSFAAFAEDSVKADADNSAKNERDRAGETVTPGDQSNDEANLKVTQAIRQAVVADESLSMNAKNVKIITDHQRVTLRGPVKTEEEKTTIDRLAKAVAGERTVDNQLEVEK